ncbi:MAG TPA: ATP-binding protein [Bacillota bacterium]|nr:ATP-binding protein [Bacillota bacterium]
MKDTVSVVAKGWYRLYFGLVVLFCALVLAGSLATRFLSGFHGLEASLGFGSVSLILAAIPLVYGVSLYWVISRQNIAAATLGLSMAFSFVLLNGLMRTDGMNGAWLYIGAWVVSLGFAGMFGIQLLYGSGLLTIVYVMVTSGFQLHAINRQSWTLLVGSILISILAYPLWRKAFINPADRELSQLSGALRSNQEQSAILIQSIADGVIVINSEGKISLINQAASLMTQWAVADAIGLDVHLVAQLTGEKGEELPPEENPFTKVLEKKERVNASLQLVGRQGRKQIISMVISPIQVPGGGVGGAVAVIHDISLAKAAEKQSAEFISTASHEMRTPVAAIEGYLALALNDKVSTIDSRARGYLEKAHSSTQHLGQLFQDLLTSAKAEDGRISNHPAVIEMGSFAQQLVEDLRFSAQKKGLATEFLVGTSDAIDATKEDDAAPKKLITPLYYIYADPDRLREVITNLFDNAVKYTDQGKISMGLTGNGEVVQFYIRDTGPGIPAEDVPHLFQKFYRVDNSATRTIGGTGLGLFICRKIIELYQGRIWVESQLGKGSTFFINMPRLDSARAQSLQQAAGSSATPSTVNSVAS